MRYVINKIIRSTIIIILIIIIIICLTIIIDKNYKYYKSEKAYKELRLLSNELENSSSDSNNDLRDEKLKEINLESISDIITLYTCSYEFYDARTIVCAVLIE